jgi:predicted DNA-binding helix-hairpin-helix protein
LRRQQDIPRCSLTPEETAKTFLDYHNQRRVFGLFLSSGLVGTPDATMDRLNTTAYLLRRKHGFKGYVHLKIIPGAGRAAIEQALSLADAVSLNIETPGEKYLARLSGKKDYIRDIIEPIKLISGLTARGCRYAKVKHTTQFIVGAAGESDTEIVKYVWGLYDRLKLHRVYFSAYQKGLGEPTIAGESIFGRIRPTRLGDPEARAPSRSQTDAFVREHRLYQVDFLIRKYGFTGSDIVFEESGNLSLVANPKESWAGKHPEAFPVDINRAPRDALLKVPGLGPVTVGRILIARRAGQIAGIEDIGRPSLRLERARKYLSF